jgi:ribosomal protein S25
MKSIEKQNIVPDSRVDKVARIYRVLLSRKIKNMTWYRIAKDADVAYGWAYRVLRNLEDRNIIEGSTIKDPKALFLTWASRNSYHKFREYHIQNPKVILMNSKMDYAFTTYYAESIIGHYLFPRNYEFYIHPKDSQKWHSYLSENGYVGRGNIKVIRADEHIFFEKGTVDNWPTVSIQQLIVDLYKEGAECVEAADLLLMKAYS